jgi:alpha-beta hydrolase superfamily lysophospholipase
MDMQPELGAFSTYMSGYRPTPLLFVHGMWHGAWCWDEFLELFADAGYHATALSLRGHSGSKGMIRGSRIADYVADVEHMARKYETPPVIIGHSMGGFITQKYLETHDAPAGVLLASIPPYGVWPALGRVFLHDPRIVLKALFTWRMYPVVETPANAHWALFSADMPKEQVLKYHKYLDDESFRAFLDLLGLNLAHPKRVKTPMLILGAEEDTVISQGDVHATARAYNTKAELFPNMAHDMMLEAGWRSVAERILNWLREKGI